MPLYQSLLANEWGLPDETPLDQAPLPQSQYILGAGSQAGAALPYDATASPDFAAFDAFLSQQAPGGAVPGNIYSQTQYEAPLDPQAFASFDAFLDQGSPAQPAGDMYASDPSQFMGGQGPTYIADLLKAMQTGAFESQPSEFARIFREQYPQEQYPLGPRQPEPFDAPIKVLEPFEQAAGEVGRRVGGMLPYATGLGLGADLFGGRGTAQEFGEKQGEAIAQGIFPNTWYSLVAELLPGISTTRGLLSFGRQAAREGIEAAVRAAVAGGARAGVANLPQDIGRQAPDLPEQTIDITRQLRQALSAGEAGAAKLPGKGDESTQTLPVRRTAGGVVEQPAEVIARGTPPPAGEEGFAGNIRLSKYPDDIRSTIKEAADANPEAVQAARRGVRSDDEVRAGAQQLIEDMGGDFQKLQRSWKPGEAWNAEEIVAIRSALLDSTRKLMDAASAARAVDSTENHLALAEALLKQQRTQQIVYGVSAESGRAQRAFKQAAAEARASGDVGRMQELLRQALGKGGTEDIGKLADAILALDINNPVAVNKFLRSINKPHFFDYMLEFWYNSILSGQFTHARNFIGNTAATATEPIRRGGAALTETALARAQGRKPERFWEEVPASVIGGIHGIPEGVRAALKTMITGFNPQAIGRVELRRNVIPGPVGRVVRIPSTALEAMDGFFHAINYRMSLWADVTRQARTEGLKGTALQDRIAQLLAEPPAALIKQAGDEAERLLFRGDPGAFARWLAQGKHAAPGLNFVLPFTRTPANLLKFGIRNSPLGLLDVPMWKRVAAGNPQGSDELAQTLMGSMVAAGFGGLVATGALDITAGPPTNSAERDRFYREGKVAFAVKVPGIGWVQYNQIPILSESLTAVASTVEGVRNGEDVSDIATSTVATIAQSLLDRSYLSGLSDFLDAVGEPARFAERFATRWVTGFIPFSSALRQTAGVIDPTMRDPEGLLESAKAGIPGLTGSVPSRLTAFGEEAQRQSPWSPIRISGESQSAVDAELGKIGAEVGFVGNTIGGHSLTREQQRMYQQAAGQATYQVLQRLIESSAYQALSDVQKEKAITKARDLAREAVRESLSDEWGFE